MLVNINALASEDMQTTALSWVNNVQPAHYLEQSIGIETTPAELAALSIALGCPPAELRITKGVDKNKNSFSSGKGAFGISIAGSMAENGKYHVSMKRHGRSISRLPPRGCGYSTLFAKHMAYGSLPFAQDKTIVSSILIKAETLEAVKTGASFQVHALDPQCAASHLLASLPASRRPAFHTLMPSHNSIPTSATILTNAIASLPFNGGLVPLAATPLIQTVHFIASAGLPVGRLLQRLDALVEKVHRQAPFHHLFGPLYEDAHAGLLFRERERLGRLAIGATTDDSVSDKAARVHRYITLIERLMALVPGAKPNDVLAAVRKATAQEIDRSYEAAVTAYQQGDLDREHVAYSARKRLSKRLSSSSSSSSGFAPRLAAVSTASTLVIAAPVSPLQQRNSPLEAPNSTSSRDSVTFPVDNLGRQVEQVLKLALPLDVRTIARVVRLVIVAWTVSVQAVGAEDLGFQGLEGEKMVLF